MRKLMSPQKLRTVLGVCDQGLISVGNLTFSILIAREFDKSTFSHFSVLFLIYVVLVGLQKSLISDPLMIHFSKNKNNSFISNSLSGSLLFCLVVSIATGIVSVFVTSDASGYVKVFALSIPFICMQDSLRYCLFSQDRHGVVLFSDVLLLTGLLASIAMSLTQFQSLESGTRLQAVLAGWGVASAVSALVMSRFTGASPGLSALRKWLSGPAALGSRFALDYLSYTLTQQGVIFAVGALGSVTAVGAIRGAQVLLGPVGVLATGLSTAVLLYLSPRHGDRWAIKITCAAFGVLLLVISASIGLATFLTPAWIGIKILGETWASASAIAPFIGLAYGLNSLGLAASLGLRVREQPGKGLKVRAITLPLTILVIPIAVYAGGLKGAVTALVLTSLISSCLWWRFLISDLSPKEPNHV